MKVSVLICTRNRPQDVETCLPTILACLRDDWEIVLVDQSANRETEAVVRSLAGSSSLLYLPTETVGKSRALNLGLGHVRGEIIAFTDDDCEAPAEWLTQVVSEMEQAPDADILFGPVLPSPAIPDLQAVCVPAWSFDQARDLRPVEICGMGANMALRRSALDRLPPGDYFDSRLGPGAPFPAGEEGDFVYRLRRAGARAVLRPSLRLYHRAFRTPSHWQTVLEGYGAGDAAFFGKHARCGDAWARRNLAERLGRGLVRACAKSLLGRRPNNDAAYVRGFLRGLRQSLRTPIDAQARLYQSEMPTPPKGIGEKREGAGRT